MQLGRRQTVIKINYTSWNSLPTFEPQELVRSCAHMTPCKGYHEARKLLHKHYGDELVIANAYVDKALKRLQVRADDGKALNAYAMFLIGCHNSMKENLIFRRDG